MVSSIIKNASQINEIFEGVLEGVGSNLAPIEVSFLKELEQNLFIFKTTTKELEFEDKPTSNEILLTYYVIKSFFKEKNDQQYGFKDIIRFRKLVRSSLRQRFSLKKEYVLSAIHIQ